MEGDNLKYASEFDAAGAVGCLSLRILPKRLRRDGGHEEHYGETHLNNCHPSAPT